MRERESERESEEQPPAAAILCIVMIMPRREVALGGILFKRKSSM